MRALKPILVVAAAIAAGPAAPQSCDAGRWYFSRSGQSSYSAVDARGDDKPDLEPRRVTPRLVGPGYGTLRPVWHGVSEYEYAPATVIPRGSRFDVVPGRYRYESTGHWEWRADRSY